MLQNKYNGLTHTFVSEPLLNETWGTLGVTLGSSDFEPVADPSLSKRRPLYNRLGGGGGSGQDITCYFYKNDRIYINDLTLYCNFADGLVKNSDIVTTPLTEVSNGGALPNYEIDGKLNVQVSTYYQQVDGSLLVGTLLFPINHFNAVNQLGTFAVESPSIINQENTVCQWIEIGMYENVNTQPAYSTININPDFQTARCLIWAEATLSHTWVTNDRDDALISASWPS